MELKLRRIARKADYTIGRLYVNGSYFCDTVEDRDRFFFGEGKVMHKTAIPAGRYEVTQDVVSPKYKDRKPYKEVCGGCVPRLLRVPQFEGILIHIGNTADDSSGCILVGRNKVVGKVVESTATWRELMVKHLRPAKARKEKVFITVE